MSLPGSEILNIKNLSKVYSKNDAKALNDVSLTINSGEFVSVIGPSGAGKSTLLRCINRMVDATQGEVIFDGQNITTIKGKALRRVRTSIGMIFQNYNLVERLSVLENVLHGRLGHKSTFAGSLGLYTEAEKKDAFDILDTLGLIKHAYKRCDELSGGQKQRVGIARALMQNPKLILCDEPIASLDPNSSKVIMDHLLQINETMGITCIVNLHQVDFALRYAGRIIGINEGTVIYDGSSQAIDEQHLADIYRSDQEDPPHQSAQATYINEVVAFEMVAHA
ncbi:MAG: phosphonate ABC transporter ATP-binding protein [Coriobacteriia bacterium]|nr:phosphonate ABC transporter ATP-binding protein [Coriobacteriia bacterium]